MPTKAKQAKGSKKAGRRPKSSKGLTVQTFKGLNEGRIKKAGGSGGKRLNLKKGDTVPIQVLQGPDEFREYYVHSWMDGDRWWFVPCAGEDCPLCADDDPKKSKKSYQFACNVYNLKDRKVQIMTGPKDLAGRVMYRYKRKPLKFLKQTYEVSKLPTNPVSYDFQRGDDELVVTKGLKLHDLDEDLEEQLKAFYGDEMPTASSLDDDEDDADDDDADDDGDDNDVSDDLEELAAAADEDEDEDAIEALTEVAEEADLDPDDFETWADLVEAILESQGDEDADDDDEDDDDEEDDDGDSDYSRSDLSKLKIAKLREIADTLDIDHDGKGKAEIIDAILEETGDDDDDDEDDEAKPAKRDKKAPTKKPAKKAAKKAPARRK